jgi:hypothetical protein
MVCLAHFTKTQEYYGQQQRRQFIHVIFREIASRTFKLPGDSGDLVRSKRTSIWKAVAQQAKPLIAALFEMLVIAFLEVIHLLSSTKDYTYLNEHSIELRNEAILTDKEGIQNS